MKIYGCQFDIAWEDKPANFQCVRALLDAAKPQTGSILFLPEMFATGFSMNVDVIAEDAMTGPTVKFLAQCAARHGIYMCGGLVTRGADGKSRNELVVIAPDGSQAARYAKIHPFTYGQESQHYSGGERICRFAWGGATVAPFICYDLRFPEIFRHATREGAEILAVIANWPQKREEHWTTLLRARAIENQGYVIGVNCCGHDPNGAYSGRSLIVDPQGTILVDGGNDERVIEADVDLASLHSYRTRFPVLGDLRGRFLGV